MSPKERAPASSTSLLDALGYFHVNCDPPFSLLHKGAKIPRDGWD